MRNLKSMIFALAYAKMNISFYSCIFLIVMNACAIKSPLIKSNRLAFDYGMYTFYNDSLKLSTQLFSLNTYEGSNTLKRKDYHFYKNIIEHHTKVTIHPENFLHEGREENPKLRSAIFYVPNQKLPEKEIVVGACTIYPIVGNKENLLLHVFCSDNFVTQSVAKSITTSYRFGGNYQAPPDPFSVARKVQENNANYLQPIVLLGQIAQKYTSKFEVSNFKQANMVFNSFVSNNSFDNQINNPFRGQNLAPLDPDLNASCDSSALTLIKDKSLHAQVVMFNENHLFSQHRYLMNQLLHHYFEQGFRYFAVEGIWENTDTLAQRGFPIQQTGFYTRDPHFGNLIRNALKMGYSVFGYDAFDNNRELAQAENIYKHTLKNHPSAKVLVYSGGSHFSKDSTSKMMGYYFKAMSGVDAFLVNQLKLADTQYDLCAHQGDQYNILAINTIKETDFKIDPLKDQFLTTINIPIDTIQEKGQKRILSIYIRDEYHAYRLQAIPVWNFMLTKTENIPVYLPKGVYVYVIRNEAGTILKQTDFTI